jgi:hypothetical protein
MPQVRTSKPLTYYVDSPSVRVFQEFAGESLDKLDEYEAWDVITVLSQAVASATANDEITIDIPEAIEALDLAISDKTQECLDALNGFPTNKVNALMLGILSVAFEGSNG